jgi:hypothetical protein
VEGGRGEKSFRLTPHEDFIFGVSFRDGQLRFGPSGSEMALKAFSAFVAFGIGALIISAPISSLNGYEVRNREALIVFALALCTLGLVQFMALMRQRVQVNAHGVEVRRHFRTRRYLWNEIESVRPMNIEVKPIGTIPMIPARWSELVRPPGVWSVGVLVTSSGSTVELPGFRSAARPDSEPTYFETTSEVKVRAVLRFRESVVGPWPDVTTDSVVRRPEVADRRQHSLLWTLVVMAFGLIFTWVVVSWAAGRPVGIAASVTAAVVGIVRMLIERDRNRPHQWPDAAANDRRGVTHYLR